MKPIERLSSKTIYAVMKTIEAHGKAVDGMWFYDDGWDDHRVAEEVGCTAESVKYRRREAFGQIRPYRVQAPENSLEQRIADIERRLSELEHRLI